METNWLNMKHISQKHSFLEIRNIFCWFPMFWNPNYFFTEEKYYLRNIFW